MNLTERLTNAITASQMFMGMKNTGLDKAHLSKIIKLLTEIKEKLDSGKLVSVEGDVYNETEHAKGLDELFKTGQKIFSPKQP